MAYVAFEDAKSLQYLPLADNDQFPRLAVGGAARPACNLEYVVDNWLWYWVWTKLADGPETT